MSMYQKQFPVEKMCKVLKVSPSGYFSWKRGDCSLRKQREQELLHKIKESHMKSHKTYGSPRIYAALKSDLVPVSRSLVARMMKKHGIRSVHAKKFKVTTDSKHKHPVANNVLDRNFQAERPAQKWVSDITYIHTKEGWLYLTIMLDLFDRKVVGWSMSTGMATEETVIPAWKMALWTCP